MQASLFKLLAIAAAFSAVHSAPVETAEATKAQVNGTQINDIFKVAGVEQTCYKKRDLPDISKRGEEGELFKRACRDESCWHSDQCRAIGCIECVLYFDICGDSWTACR